MNITTSYIRWLDRKKIRKHNEEMRVLNIQIRAITKAAKYEVWKDFLNENPQFLEQAKAHFTKKPR